MSHHRSIVRKLVEVPSISMTEADCCPVTSEEPWYKSIHSYLLTGSCKEGDEQMIKAKSARFTMVGTYLYRRGYSRSLLKCITNTQADTSWRRSTNEYAVLFLEREAWWLGCLGPDTIGRPCKQTTLNILKSERFQEFGSVMHSKPKMLHNITPHGLHHVGDGHYRTLSSGKRSMLISFGRSGLFHEMDWGRALSGHHCSKNAKLRLKEHYL